MKSKIFFSEWRRAQKFFGRRVFQYQMLMQSLKVGAADAYYKNGISSGCFYGEAPGPTIIPQGPLRALPRRFVRGALYGYTPYPITTPRDHYKYIGLNVTNCQKVWYLRNQTTRLGITPQEPTYPTQNKTAQPTHETLALMKPKEPPRFN